MQCLFLSVYNASAQDSTTSVSEMNATYASVWDSQHGNSIDISKVP
jgi:hypothetical protein